MCPNEVCCLWLYQRDDVPSLDQFSSRVERTRSSGRQLVFLSGSHCHRLDLDGIDDHNLLLLSNQWYTS